MVIEEDEYLAHHGIQGQKWGVRRYQNPDGSLTREGLSKNRLKRYDSEVINNDTINKYKSQYKQLQHIRLSKNTNGRFYSKNGQLVGMINVETKDDGNKWIQGLEVFGDNQGKGLGTALLDISVNEMGATHLSVNKSNHKAKHIYEKYGFESYSEDDTMYYMKLPDHISHHGIQGQKWGVRNGPPYPIKGSSSTLSNGNAKKLDGYRGKAYFISEKDMDYETLKPRVPKNYMTKNGYEDSETPRVSFAPSIEQCLAGLSQNVEDKQFYVYEPVDISKCDVYRPNTKAVPDADITGELWITNDVPIKRVGKIKVTGNLGKDGKVYSYGDDQAMLFDDWTYEDVKE